MKSWYARTGGVVLGVLFIVNGIKRRQDVFRGLKQPSIKRFGYFGAHVGAQVAAAAAWPGTVAVIIKRSYDQLYGESTEQAP